MNLKNKSILNQMNKKRLNKFTKRLNLEKNEYLLYDMSKTHLSENDLEEYRSKLMKLNLNEKIEAMWRGDLINTTEKQAVLHTLLRNNKILDSVKAYCKKHDILKKKYKCDCKEECKCDCKEEYKCDCKEECKCDYLKQKESKKIKIACNKSENNDINILKNERNIIINEFIESNKSEKLIKEKTEILNELINIYDFCEDFKTMKGIKEEKMKYIVSIGIGGSDLGPRMVCEALEEYSQKGYEVYFISNIDSSDTRRVLNKIEINRTLFIIVSKTFTTQETIENFKLVKAIGIGMIRQDGGDKEMEKEFIDKHFIAISSNIKEVKKYGINRIFKMWDFIGGRYSLWSAVGISIGLYIGFENFLKMLNGGSIADNDFYEQKSNSIAVIRAIIDLYYEDKNYNNKCLVAYDSYLGLLYKYMQQAEMESNGKKGSKQMIIWGGIGTDVQHSFFQLLHQGEQNILTEFIVGAHGIHERRCEKIKKHHELLLANCLAQSRSLMIGKESNEKCKEVYGNKPSITIMYSKLSPEILGGLIATYEHKIFIQGIYYGINSFDQYGVTLGKEIAVKIFEALKNDEYTKFDISTNFLIENIKK